MSEDSRFCPNCGSENVEPDFRRTNVLGDMMFNQNKWVCKECGYAGLMPQLSQVEKDCSEQQPEGLLRLSGEPEEDEELEMVFEEKEQETIDKTAGRAYYEYTIYILTPLTLLYTIYLILF